MYRIMTSEGNRTANSLIEVQRLYHRGEIAIDDILERDTGGKRRLVGDALGESLLGSGAGVGGRRAPIPPPPPIQWSAVLLIGCVTGGWGLSWIGLIQGIWSCRFQRRATPILWPLGALLIPPLHLFYAISLFFHHHPEILQGLIHLFVGFCVAEAVSVVFTSLGSLAVRKTLLNRFGEQGFQMNFLLTALISVTFVAYKADELRRLHE